MLIKQLTVKNFRGIKELNWIIKGRIVCLIGSNNATKTTVLEAIYCVLSPHWNLSFSDSDFYQSEIVNSIEIILTIGELPSSLKSLQKFGGYLRGWNSHTGLTDEPSDGDEDVLTIRLSVDKSLEPRWEIICDRGETLIRSTDREKLGISRVNAYVDRDLSWGKGSVLYRVTENIKGIDFSEISRNARNSVSGSTLHELQTASENVERMAKSYGVKPLQSFNPAFDADMITIGTSTLSLHDGDVPVKLYGLGSKKLISFAMQRAITSEGTILLIDEVEHGLEPYKLRQLIRLLRDSTIDNNGSKLGQIFLTTHSQIAVVECIANELNIVRNQDGITNIFQIEDSFQGTVRSSAEALLSPRIIVCEGKTEVGILRAFDRKWMDDNQGAGMAYYGVFPINGGGRTDAPKRAIELKKLGYDVLLFVDSDEPIVPDTQTVENQGVKVVQWQNKTNTEDRIFLDLQENSILEIIKMVIDITDNEINILQDLGSQLGISGFNLDKLETQLKDSQTSMMLRNALARMAASKAHSWFKRTDYGEKVGMIVASSIELVPLSEFCKGIKEIKDWTFS